MSGHDSDRSKPKSIGINETIRSLFVYFAITIKEKQIVGGIVEESLHGGINMSRLVEIEFRSINLR